VRRGRRCRRAARVDQREAGMTAELDPGTKTVCICGSFVHFDEMVTFPRRPTGERSFV